MQIKTISKGILSTALAATLGISPLVHAEQPVYVQASKGSFNDAAITQLFSQHPELKAPVDFAGTPTNTFKMANERSGLAFSAVENSTIDGRLVQATVEAFQQYKPVDLKGFITTPIEMCVLMNTEDVKTKHPITLIASHPAALKQINLWKTKQTKAKELAVPEGTAAAAKQVSERQLPAGSVAIGACVLESTYTNLAVIEKGVQDNKDNKTSFLLMDISKRETPITEAQARKALIAAIKQGKALAK
ncbi:prephenate dehydratase domain-containing protein [Vibrio campbellii]|nr:prephenate dehydratase [Vibrio campbellii]